MTELTVGIDFGTTNCAVVLYEGIQAREPRIFDIDKVAPFNLLRSVVGYRKDELHPAVGETVRQNLSYYDDVIESVKLRMNEGNKKTYTLATGEKKSPIEVAAEIFKYMKSRIEEDFAGEAHIQKVAITVPAIFDVATRQNILEAARLGGFEVSNAKESLIDEPTAASESFDTFGELKDGNRYLIFDFGAGTLDLSYFEKKTVKFEQIATGGKQIGGNDFDKALNAWVIEKCRRDLKLDLNDEGEGVKFFGDQTSYELTLFEIRDRCRIAKEELSSLDSKAIAMRLLPGKSIDYRITRAEFENLVADKIRVVRHECENLQREVERKVGRAVPERIYLVGGASLMPFVSRTIQEVFGRKPWRGIGDLQGPKFCVAAGAARFAKIGVAPSLVRYDDSAKIVVERLKDRTIAEIFLSYAREDESKVEKIYQKLLADGFKPWMDAKDLLPGERWKVRIRDAIRRSNFFLAILTTNSIKRTGFFEKEVDEALDIWLEKSENDIYLIPVRVDDCELPERLHEFHCADLFKEHGWTQLIKALKVMTERQQKAS